MPPCDALLGACAAGGEGLPRWRHLHHDPVSEMAGAEPVPHVLTAFAHALCAHSYVEGRNLGPELRSVGGRCEPVADFVAELLHRKPTVLVTSASWRARRSARSPGARDCEVCRLDDHIAQNNTKPYG